MGREIRRVPPDWEHPRQECKHSPWAGGCDESKAHNGRCYKPLYDNDYHSAAREWIDAFDLWRQRKHPDQSDYYTYYWEYAGVPDEEYYRERAWAPEEATAYQIYETVSEGTPVSPVFEALPALVDWLVDQGYSRHAAECFAKDGWVMSVAAFVPGDGSPGIVAENIHAFDLMPREEAP